MPKKKTTTTTKKTAITAVSKAPAKKAARKTVKKAAKKPAKKAVKKATKRVTKKAAKEVVKPTSKAPAQKKPTSEASISPAAREIEKDEEIKKSHDSGSSKSTPIVFSLDDVEQLMATKKSEAEPAKTTAKKVVTPKKKVIVEDQPVKQRVLGAASLADILGFNPAEKNKNTDLSAQQVPKKWKKYYNLLIELRGHVGDELDLHTADTLKHSSRDESGDLSSYGTHQADSGTDTFDRDFALSLVSSEQEALNEIEEAILRIKDGTYGVCEVTGKAIPAARLTAVPFARYSVEGQAEYEKNVRRKVDRTSSAGLFGDASDAPKIAASDDDE